MKLAKTLVLAAAIASFVIGIHLSLVEGFEYSYWIFMITISLLLFNRLIGGKDKPRKKDKKPAKKKRKHELQGNRQMRRAMKK